MKRKTFFEIAIKNLKTVGTFTYSSKYLIKQTLKPDHIVSALPMVVLPKELVHQILETSAKQLPPGGYFTQITYSLFDKNLYKKYFKNVELKYTPLNFPPAFTYICNN